MGLQTYVMVIYSEAISPGFQFFKAHIGQILCCDWGKRHKFGALKLIIEPVINIRIMGMVNNTTIA